MQKALRLKEEVNGVSPVNASARSSDIRKMRNEFWKPNPVSGHCGPSYPATDFMTLLIQWEALPATPLEAVILPPADLIYTLVDQFFSTMGGTFPVLHRPTFMKQLHDDRHRRDIDFTRLILTVCGVAARFCKDERVCTASPTGEVEWRSAGSKYLLEAYKIKREGHSNSCSAVILPV